jgi:hypothetical protein
MLRLITEGALSGFLNWTLIYPFKYWSHFPDYVQMQLSNRQGLVLILLILSVAIAFFKVKRHLIFYMYFLISLLLIYPRFSFFHFQLGLAFLAILYGLILSKIKRFPYVPGTVFLIFAIVVIGPTLVRDWCGETRFWAKEDVRLAEMIKNKTKPEDKIYLVGPHSGLYVLADRLPPKIWSDNYVWYLEIPQVQEKIITSWEEDPPKYVFTAEPQKGNWYDLGTYRPQKIVDWIDKQKINKLVLSE